MKTHCPHDEIAEHHAAVDLTVRWSPRLWRPLRRHSEPFRLPLFGLHSISRRRQASCSASATAATASLDDGDTRPHSCQPFADVIHSSPTQPAERAIAPHPSLKPQAFLRQVVRAMLPLGEGVILDPFAGSGSTLAAAEAVGYRSIGVEADLSYIEVAKLAIPKLAALDI